MKQKYEFLSKNIILFTISTFGPRIISFLLIPLYTHFLSTTEYGISELILSTTNLLLPVFIVCIDAGVLRFSLKSDYEESVVYSSSIYILIRGIILGVLFVILVSIFYQRINKIYLLFGTLFFIANSTYNFYSAYCRGIDKTNIMVEISLINTLLTGLLNVLFLAVLQKGIYGYMIANFSGTYLSILWGIFRLKDKSKIEFNKVNKSLVTEIQKYSIPLIFNQIGWWINNSVDKYIVSGFLGTSANGIYSVSYKIPTILTTISGVFANAWSISAIKEFDPEDKDSFVINLYNIYNTVLVISCSAIMLLNIHLAKILYSEDFFVAWKYTGPLVIAVIFGAFSGFIGAIFSAAKDTKVYSTTTILGGIVNIVFSLILIQYIGITGVAIGTLISNIVIWGLRLFLSRKYIKLRINYFKDWSMYILLFIQYIIGLEGLTYRSMIAQVIILLSLIIINIKNMKSIFSKIINSRKKK